MRDKGLTLEKEQNGIVFLAYTTSISFIETGNPVLVSSIDIEDILEEFEYNHLDAVYTHLGLEYKDIQNERLATTHRRGQEKKILNLWRNSAAERATRERMVAAMEQVPQCRASLNKLREGWNNGSPGEYDIRYIKSMGTFLFKLVSRHIQ